MKVINNNNPLFALVCGFEHSGTTLVSEILRQHPQLDSGFEGGFLLNNEAKEFLTTEPFYTNSKKGWGLKDEDLSYICNGDNWAEVYLRIRERAEVIKNKNVSLFDKTPRYMQKLPNVLERVPDIPCIVIVKDIRSVFWSSYKRAKMTMDEWHKKIFKRTCNHTLSYAKGWKEAIEKGLEKRILLIKYEELCLDQKTEVKKIFDFLGREFQESYLTFNNPKYNNVYGGDISTQYLTEYQGNLPEYICEEILELTSEYSDWLWSDRQTDKSGELLPSQASVQLKSKTSSSEENTQKQKSITMTKTNQNNDISNDQLDLLFKCTSSPQILTEIVDISRKYFGWYTKQFTRGIEYPWVIQKVFSIFDGDLRGKKILDVGAGVSPLPLLFSQYGAEVTTIDYSKLIRKLESKDNWHEWGFLDYSVFDKKIRSLNENIFNVNFEANCFDIVYSVSVIEHMPKVLRVGFFEKTQEFIKSEGNLILTLDVIPWTDKLWYYDRGKVVEDPSIHGTLEDLEKELSKLSFQLDVIEKHRNTDRNCPDLVLLSAKGGEKEKGIDQEVENCRKKAILHPNFARNYYDWAVALLKSERFTEAQGVINKAIELNPIFCESTFVFANLRDQLETAFKDCKTWSWPAVQLGAGLSGQGKFSEAELYLRDMVEHRLVDNEHTYGRGFLHLCQGILAKNGSNKKTAKIIKEICLKDVERNGKKIWSHIFLGAALKLENKLSEAYQHFERAASFGSYSSLIHTCLGCLSIKDYHILTDIPTDASTKTSSWLEEYSSGIVFFDEPEKEDNSPILLVTCCDSKYFQMFSEILTRSCFTHDSDVPFHFHVVNPEAETFKIWENLKKLLSDFPVSLSYETIKIRNLKVYYTMVRFLRINDFIVRYQKNIVMIDSDAVMTGNLSSVLKSIQKFDVGLNIKKNDNYFPWRSITADLVYASPKEEAKKFFASVSKYLELTFEPNAEQNFWWIDQNALFAAYQWCKEFEPSIKIGNLYDVGVQIVFAFAPNHASKKEKFIADQKAALDLYKNIKQAKERNLEVIDTEYGVFYSYEGDTITGQLKRFGAHSRSELAMLLDLVRQGDTIVDVGAHIGTFAIPWASKVDNGGRVYAFEANQDNFSILMKNVEKNGKSNVITAYCAIVTDKEGKYKLKEGISTNTMTYYYELEDEEDMEHGSACISLENWYKNLGSDGKIDLIKIDVEGAEVNVLTSAKKIIEKNRPIIYIEVSSTTLSRYGHSVDEIEGLLKPYGYHFFRNISVRNTDSDKYEIAWLENLEQGGSFYDLLAIHPSSDRYPSSFSSYSSTGG